LVKQQKEMTMRFYQFATLVLALAGVASAADVTFTIRPAVTRDGEKTKIAFTVSAKTDVEVAILGADGRIVRHLAAGVIGGKTAAEPLTPGLAQEMVWDGTDDQGRKVEGPTKVRVRAGLSPKLDGFLLDNPASSGPVNALAVGPSGSIYVFHHDPMALPSNWGSKKLKIYDRDGKHVRVVMPCPADLPPEMLEPLAPFYDTEGRLVPRIHSLRRESFLPEPAPMFMGNQSPIVDSRGRVYWLVFGPRLAALDADGGVPYETFLSEPLLPQIEHARAANQYLYRKDAPAVALSSDEKFIYLAGFGTGQFGRDAENQPIACVFRVDLFSRGPAEAFVGRPDTPGTQKELLTAPRGLATANGLLYVADPSANRVAVFRESDRSFVGEIKIDDPQGVAVDPASGAVYVCVYTGKANPAVGKQHADLVKFDGYQNAQELYRLTLPKTLQNPNRGEHRIAIDRSAKPLRVYLTGLYPHFNIGCFEDTGEEFVDRGDPRNLETPWAEGPRDLSLDRVRGELYVKVSNQYWHRFDEPTGRPVEPVDLRKLHKYALYMSNKGTQIVPCPDGSLVSMNWSEGIIHHDRKGLPIAWPDGSPERIHYGGIMSFMMRTLALSPDGRELVVVLPNTYALARRPTDAERARLPRWCSVDVIGWDGKPKRTAVWQCTHGAVLRVDHKGNIYLGETLKPVGRSYPEFFDGKLEPMTASRRAEDGDASVFWGSYMYGSIVKFPPSGGAIWYDKERRLSPSVVGRPPADLLAKPTIKMQGHVVYKPNAPAEVQGAEWVRFGFAPFAMHSGSDTCMCEGAGFDIDLFGRVFYPNLGQFRVEVVDAANNLIGSFGHYGNQDAPTTGKTAGIPLAWPLSVVASDTHAYVADTLNRRVVKVKLDYALDASTDVP
jgi:hypothetical protein